MTTRPLADLMLPQWSADQCYCADCQGVVTVTVVLNRGQGYCYELSSWCCNVGKIRNRKAAHYFKSIHNILAEKPSGAVQFNKCVSIYLVRDPYWNPLDYR